MGKKHTEKHSETEKVEEEITLDFNQVSKTLKKFLPLLILLIPLLVSVYVRTMPERMPIADQWARDSLYNNIKNNLAASVAQQYPNLPQQSVQSMVDQQFSLVISQQKAQVEQAVVQQAAGIRDSFADDTGYRYLGDIDSYFWLRYEKNIVEKGIYGDEIRNGVQYDNHMEAPLGFPVDNSMYPYIEAFLYRILSFFNSKISLMQSAFYTPLFLSFIAIIAAFFIGKKLGGNLAGFTAAMLIAVNPTVLSRSLGSDNDMVNIAFPLVIMLFTLYAFDSKNIKSMLVFSAFAGLFTGIYSFAWSGWWFLFLFIVGAGVSYIGYLVLQELKKERKFNVSLFKNRTLQQNAALLLVFMVFTYLSLFAVGNQDQFTRSFFNPIKITNLKEASKGTTLWPNVYTTVAELNAADLNSIISSVGAFTITTGQKSFSFPLLIFALLGALFPFILFKTESQKLEAMKKGVLGLSFFYYMLLIFFVNGIMPALSVIIIWLLIVISLYIMMKNTVGEKSENMLLPFSGVLSLFLIIFPLFSGNIVLFMLSLAAPFVLSILLSLNYNYHTEMKHGLILLLWVLATIYAATKGVRFILLIVPAFTIAFSVFLEVAGTFLSNTLNKSLGITKNLTYGFVVFVLLFLVFMSTTVTSTNIGYTAGYSTAYNYIPSINDGWVSSLTKINQESKPNAIINSWWDFGHWFKYWADRAVTFDGASQNEAQAHWIGKVLLTNNESQAVAILRMLDCGANNAFYQVDNEFNDTHKSIDETYTLLGETKSQAQAELKGELSPEAIANVTNFMYCQAPEDFFITSDDMVGKSGVWAHFGIWDFKRAEMYNYFKDEKLPEFTQTLKEQYNYSKDQAEKIYYEINALKTDNDVNNWISPWPSYGGMAGCSPNGNNLMCNVQVSSSQVIPVTINLSNMEAYVSSQQGQIYYPNAFAYVENGEYKVKRYNNNQIGYAIALLQDNRTLVVMSEELVDSMFTRLFYFDGVGLKNFQKFYDTRDITGARIITWKIQWPNG